MRSETYNEINDIVATCEEQVSIISHKDDPLQEVVMSAELYNRMIAMLVMLHSTKGKG